ncbi:hypothetical protein KFK09_011603 [Dendrobium nobile]|uniref:Uncharacterized protein n=1 Tax=Dendrobium nobile TaxID=94219 RepID=A0A8T3BFH5_DENNO|nr:hypothetical protein KFK09_011603 [Dendrobium nobile]
MNRGVKRGVRPLLILPKDNPANLCHNNDKRSSAHHLPATVTKVRKKGAIMIKNENNHRN